MQKILCYPANENELKTTQTTQYNFFFLLFKLLGVVFLTTRDNGFGCLLGE